MKPFFQQALANAVGGLILAASGGVGYLCWSVPRQLDLLLQNQHAMSDRFGVIEGRLNKDEEELQGINVRVTRLETR